MEQPEKAFAMQTRDLFHFGEQAALFAALGLAVQRLHSFQVLSALSHGHLVFCRHALTSLGNILI